MRTRLLWLGAISIRANQYRSFSIEVRERVIEVFDFGQVVEDDIRIRRIMNQEVLMVVLRRVKALQRVYLRDDRPGKSTRFLKLTNVSLGNPLLRIIGVENN